MKEFENFDLTTYNSYKVKSTCSKAYFPDNDGDIVSLYEKDNKYILLGSGHNVILTQSYYEAPFIIFNGNYAKLEINRSDNTVEAEAGVFTKDLSIAALEAGLSGFEMFYDIPSSIGGAVVMNAGASGEEIKDILIKVRYLDLADMKIKEIVNKDLGFEYRNSYFQKNTDKIILKVWLQLKPGDKKDISKKMETVKKQRWAKQPKTMPNAGSVFKRPKGYYVGAIIDELNLKGFTVGGAKISEKHGGFIVNFNNATGDDIHQIIKVVQKKVKEKYDVDLEVEQRII